MDIKSTKNSIIKLATIGMMGAVQLLASFVTFQESLPEGEQMWHKNQDEMGNALVSGIVAAGVFFQIVVALTQSGKTGCMNALIKHCIEHAENKIVPENIFVITGISSKDWVIQTRGRMPDMIEKQIFHRNDLKKLAKILKGKKNVLIIVDEVHIACGKKMSINKMMRELGYKDPEYLMKKNINFVEFSATPGAVLTDHREWEQEGKAKIHIMDPGKGYKGPRELLNGRAFKWKKLDEEGDFREKSIDAIKELKSNIEKTYKFPRFHIIRAPKGDKFEVVVERFMGIFGTDDYEFESCHSETEKNIDDILRNGGDPQKSPKEFLPPTKHTFIFIKETMRCAYTIGPKQNVGVLYERYTSSPNEHVVVQGMAGRACGYNVPDDMIVYTDVRSLEAYYKDWTTGFQNIEHYSKKETAFSQRGFDKKVGDDSDSDMSVDDHKVVPFTNFEEVKEFITDKNGPIRAPRGPKKLKKNTDGFIRCKVRGNEKVWSEWDMRKETRCNIKNKAGYKLNVCYEDENNPDTLIYLVCFSPEHIHKTHPSRF